MSYTSDKIFDKPSVNTFIDNMFYLFEKYIYDEEKVINIKLAIGLSGRAAALLQDDTTGEIRNIIFVIIDEDLFDFAKKMVVPNGRAIYFKEKILIYIDYAYIELHKVESFTKVDYESISVQLSSEISTEFL